MPTRQLTEIEQQSLVRLEAVVDRFVAGLEEGLPALLEIQRRQLWKAYADDFWDYVALRWGKHARTIRRMLTREEVVETVCDDFGQTVCEDGSAANKSNDKSEIPKPSQAAACELNRLKGRPQAQKEDWLAAVEEARADGRRNPRRSDVRKVIDARLAAEAEDDPPPEEITATQDESARRADRRRREELVLKGQKLLNRALETFIKAAGREACDEAGVLGSIALALEGSARLIG